MSDDRRQAGLDARRQRLAARRQGLVEDAKARVATGKERQALALERYREKRKRLKSTKEERRRPSRWWWLLALLLLLLLLLQPCRCTPEPPPNAEEGAEIQRVEEPVIIEPAPIPLPPLPRTPRRDRPSLPAPDPGPPSWIDAFRLQVSSRAPRLAECLEGSQAPGRFKWTTSVDPADGTVSEHSLEPVLLSAGLMASERACVLRVLSSPPYRLKTGTEPATPSRVGLVVEF